MRLVRSHLVVELGGRAYPSVSLDQPIQRQGLIEESARLIHVNDGSVLAFSKADWDSSEAFSPTSADCGHADGTSDPHGTHHCGSPLYP